MRIITAFLINLLVFSSLAMSQDGRQLTQEKPAVNSDKRIALVIGNGAYRHASTLANPANDAAAMAKSLRDVGFEVIGGESAGINLTQEQMESLITEFGERLRVTKGVGLFYYAGHGVTSNGQNYLVPVDAEIPDETKVKYKAIPVGMILDEMSAAGNSFNLVILDACRNNPFARSWRSVRDVGESKGLVNSNPPRGTLILYATQPGGVSSDGAGKNGLFTEALLKQIKKPNLEFDPLVKAVARDVEENSKQKQSPWKEGLYSGDFYFVRAEAKTIPAKTETLTATDAAAVEREAWGYIKNSGDPQDFRDFLKDFPSGANSGNAKIKLEQAAWDVVKDSKDKTKIQAYLTEFSSGTNAPLARIRLRQLDAPVVTPTKTVGNNSGSTAAGTVRKNPLGMELVYIPQGEFMMGSSEAEIDEALYESKKYNINIVCKREIFTPQMPKHKVTITNGFWMGKYEVTQGQCQSVMGDNPSKFTDCGANCPVEQVNWDDIQVFLKRLNAKNDGYEYSLPSEAQWEYAARAGTTTAFAYGDSLNSSQANFDGNYPYASTKGTYIRKTVTVGNYRPNAWGLYDMHGNVWEWVQDIYNSSYQDLPSDGTANLSVGDSSVRALRGGSFADLATGARSANRGREASSVRDVFGGFRVAARGR